MSEQKDAIVVFTDESAEHIIEDGGSGEWLLDPVRAKQCTWLVCTQNRHTPYHASSAAEAPHKSGFLVGRISGLRQASTDSSSNRWLIEISEYAPINYPDLWDGGRNPRRYTSLEDLGISVDGLEFQPIPLRDAAPRQHGQRLPDSPPTMLTILEAKKALAATFGVNPEAIEITIRG